MASFEASSNGTPGVERGLATAHASLHAEVQASAPMAKTGLEAHALQTAAAHIPAHVPGLESLAAIPGAHEPISPLIQLIMRMPGHIGIVSSFFEAIGNLFLPHADFLANFDFSSLLGSHLHGPVLGALPTDHPAIALSALPHDAHILADLAQAGTTNIHMGDTVMHLHQEGAFASRSALNVSGTVDLGKPQYEGLKAEQATFDRTASAGQDVLAGPGLTQVSPVSHLAGARTVFSHRLFEGIGRNSPVTPSTATSQATSQLSPQLNASGQVGQANPAALNASGRIGDGAISGAAPAQIGQPGHLLGQFGPSGAVSDVLGGRHLIAMHNGTDVSAPSLDASSASDQYLNQVGAVGQDAKPLMAMKAKELSLNGGDAQTSLHAPSLDKSVIHGHSVGRLIGHQAIGHKALHSQGGQSRNASTGGAAASPSQATQSSSQSQPTTHGSGAKPAVASDQTTIASNSVSQAQTATASSYMTRSGDSLWSIAKNNLGNAMRWQDIYKMNMDKIGANPGFIHTGTSLQMPADGSSLASTGAEASKYVVHSGDNLWNISGKMLGSHARWGEIYRLNSDLIGTDPRSILPGQELRLPGATDSTSAIADANVIHNVAPDHIHHAGEQLAEAGGANVSHATQQIAQHTTPHIPQHATPQSAPHRNEHLAEAAGANANQAIHVQTSMIKPLAPQPSIATNVTLSHPTGLSGPGGANAANLDFTNAATQPPIKHAIVSPSLAPDLSSFFSKH
jgi:LysM repeat protein